MAKGDHQRLQNAVNYSTAQAQQPLNETRQRTLQQGQLFNQNYATGSQQNLADYNSIMNNYNQFRNPGMAAGGGVVPNANYSGPDLANAANWTPENINAYAAAHGVNDPNFANYWMQHKDELFNRGQELNNPQYALMRLSMADEFGGPRYGGGATNDPMYNSLVSALGGYQNFADTGGFSPQDIQNIRARMISPIRSIYSQANSEVDRQRRLQHGYSPNYTAAKAKMAREQAYSTSDATTNAEAAIAQMLQQGKLAGLGGLSQTSLGGRGQNLQSISGQTGLYGANPGLSQTFGNQVLGNQQQDLAGQNLQQQLDEMRIRGQEAVSQVPGNFQSTMGNIASLLGVGGQIGSILTGFPGLFGGGASSPYIAPGVSQAAGLDPWTGLGQTQSGYPWIS